MKTTLDRYVIRQTLLPAFLGLLVFAFLLVVDVLLPTAEELIAKNVPAGIILTLTLTLLPQALGLAIPMALLLGLLVAFGRLSTDREWVALQACGIGLTRLLWPVALLSTVAFAATSYVLLVALPNANQNYREIIFSILSTRAEGEVKPRVFFQEFPNLVLYVRDLPRSGGWQGVFLADSRPGQPQAIYVARQGRVVINRDLRRVEMVLEDGGSHMLSDAGSYEISSFDRTILSVNPETVFPRIGPGRGEREMAIPELRERIVELERQGLSTVTPRVEIHKKFAIPFACLVFGLIGLSLGASTRREGRLASFVVGIVVIFTYYVLLESSSNLARGGFLPPWLAVWLPNVVFGTLGIWLFVRRLRAIGRSSRWAIGLAALQARLPGRPARPAAPTLLGTRLTFPRLLDRYVMLLYGRIFAIAGAALVGVFHLSTFIDLSDEVLRGDATWSQLGGHVWFATPQALYYVLPISVLLATLTTIGMLTRHSELVVMKACGMSLYRVAVPLVLTAAVVSGVLWQLQERLLGPANYRAEGLRHVIRGRSPETFDVLSRRWVTGTGGEIYNYDFFNPRERVLGGLSVYRLSPDMSQVEGRTFAERASFAPDAPAATTVWHAERGWARDFSGPGVSYEPFDAMALDLEPADYFSTQEPNPDFMSYGQLRDYIARLDAGGLDVIEQRVALERKVAFPLATLIMTLIGVPFAVTTGSRGAMYGIGVGIVLAFLYWGAMSVFAALGTAGLMEPALAAWSPNALFGAGAGYLVLTART
ncbi:MAG: YjgP/YjgQ family permease [Acidimicrobiia bacterium]|nr:YjgP/YjgQ family permease [Acidimicrobiia bacterium]